MCGRARCSLNPQQVARACGFPPSPTLRTIHANRFRPTYNASPGCYMPVAMLCGSVGASTEVAEEPVVHCMKWGLVPSFTGKHDKPDHFRMFNARSESVKEKASFRRLVPKNRCLVAVEGFYEWKKDGSKKQPYYIHFKDQRPLVFAALYDNWMNSEGEVLHTFTILTTSSSSTFQRLHDRMPVIFGDTSSSNEWLTSPVSKLDSLLHPYEGSDLVWYPVTPAMGKTSFDGPECIKELKLSDSKPISNFFVKKSGSIKSDYSSEAHESLTPFKSTASGNMKREPLFEGIDDTPVRTKQDDNAEEADLVRAMKEEPCYEDIPEPTVDSTLDGIESKVEILGTEHAKDIKHSEECGRYKGSVGDSELGGSRREVDAHGVKMELAEIEPALAPTTKKRGRCVKTAGEGQSTLLSFFGKK